MPKPLSTETVVFGVAAYFLVSAASLRGLSYLYAHDILQWIKSLDEEMAYSILSLIFDVQILISSMLLLLLFTFHKMRQVRVSDANNASTAQDESPGSIKNDALLIRDVDCKTDKIVFTFDNRFKVKRRWRQYSELCYADQTQRLNWQIIENGTAVFWPTLNKTLTIESIIGNRYFLGRFLVRKLQSFC